MPSEETTGDNPRIKIHNCPMCGDEIDPLVFNLTEAEQMKEVECDTFDTVFQVSVDE